MMVVEPKTTQPVEPDEKPVDILCLTGWRVQKPSLSSTMLIQPVKVWSRGGQGPTITCHALNANG